MSTIKAIYEGIQKGKALAEETEVCDFFVAERHVFDFNERAESRLALGDNLRYMKWLLSEGYGESVRCIYIDPPFFTKAKYDATFAVRDEEGKTHRFKHLAYDDTFDRDLECYIANMTARLLLMKELLAKDGLMWVHLDWHSAHYIKVVLDEVFGCANFRNEIIWKYKSGGSGKRHFSRKHDTLLLYSKGKEYYLDVPQEKSYNRGLKPYRFKGVKEYRDEYGWYTMVNMKDVWSIDMVGRTSHERNGYATQKPLELMKRVIEASTEPGDLVADFFCGSGSFLAAAETLGRRWIGCDREMLAVGSSKKRLDAGEASYLFSAEKGGEPFRAETGASVVLKSSELLENGKRLFVYSLASFHPEVDYGHIPLKDRAAVEALAQKHPEGFIDCIMIDTDYRETFSAEMSVTEHFDEMRFLSRGNVAFLLVDIFGREYFIHGE